MNGGENEWDKTERDGNENGWGRFEDGLKANIESKVELNWSTSLWMRYLQIVNLCGIYLSFRVCS